MQLTSSLYCTCIKLRFTSIAQELGIPESIIKKAPSAGLWEGQSDEEEIGLSYAEIDHSLRALELQGWQAATPIRRKGAWTREKKRAQKTFGT